jgi:hypothetical protein
MSAQELAAWYRTQTSDNQPLMPQPQDLVDDDWRLGWE